MVALLNYRKPIFTNFNIKVNNEISSPLAINSRIVDFMGMDTAQINFRMSRGMLDAIMTVSGKPRRYVPVYIRQAVALMLKIDGVKIDPAWVELKQGARTDMNTPEGRSRAEKQLVAARAVRARKRSKNGVAH